MNKQIITILILSIVLLAIIFFIIKNMNDPLSERIYIINTYLYIYASLIIIILFSTIMDKFDLFQELNTVTLLIIFILSIVSIFGIIFTPTGNHLLKHIFLLLLLFSLSVIAYQWYKIALNNNTLWQVIITLGAIMLGLTIYAYTQPLDAFNSWGSYLMIGLSGLITVQIADMIFGSSSGLLGRSKIYSWIAIIIFGGFLLYDTQNIRKNAILITNSCPSRNQLECADYPRESIGVVLDLINLFANLVNVNTG